MAELISEAALDALVKLVISVLPFNPSVLKSVFIKEMELGAKSPVPSVTVDVLPIKDVPL